MPACLLSLVLLRQLSDAADTKFYMVSLGKCARSHSHRWQRGCWLCSWGCASWVAATLGDCWLAYASGGGRHYRLGHAYTLSSLASGTSVELGVF